MYEKILNFCSHKFVAFVHNSFLLTITLTKQYDDVFLLISINFLGCLVATENFDIPRSSTKVSAYTVSP